MLGQEPQLAEVLYARANLPNVYWDTNVTPRFKEINVEKNSAQGALQQAQVYNSLMKNPRQLLEFPRRWRLATYSEPIEYGQMVLANIAKEAIKHGMAVRCTDVYGLPQVMSQESRYHLVFVHDVFDDMEIKDLMPLRLAHSRNFHLMYSMTGQYAENVEKMKVSPDYAFQVAEARLYAATARRVF